MKKSKAPSKAVTQPNNPQPAPEQQKVEPKRSFIECAKWKGGDGLYQSLLIDDNSGAPFIQEGRVKSRYAQPSGKMSEPRRLTVSAAFHWWLERHILHEKTGNFTDGDDTVGLFKKVDDILSEMEQPYMLAKTKRQQRAAKEWEKKYSTGGAK